MTLRHPLRVLSFLAIGLAGTGTASGQTSQDVNLIGTWDGASSYSDVWGYSAPNGTELAIIGLGNGGVSFINVTNPASPQEVFRAPGGTTVWRDIKTYGTYAYCVDDQAGNGLIVVNLANPLAPVEVRRRTTEFTTSHNVWIDQEYGLLFACGAGSGGNHTYVYDLTQDPSNPQYIYDFDDFYVHDLYTLDGVAYLAAIFDGQLYTADITTLLTVPRSMPVLGSLVTDDAFTHNVWTTEDGRYALTTDEVGGGHITIVDVSNPANLVKVSDYQHPTNPSAIIHNVTVEGDLCHVAWYTNGYEIVDISVPSSPVRAGFYDEFPGNSANYDGAWGVYPYADNGLTYISDISTGLWIFEFAPSYGSVAGVVTDAVSGDPVAGATVAIPSEGLTRTSGEDGNYKFNLDPGSYTIEIEAFGYAPESFGVSIVAGQTADGDRALDRLPGASLGGVVLSSAGFTPLPGAGLELLGTPLSATSDGSGGYAFSFVPAGTYTLRAERFGFGAAVLDVDVEAGSPLVRDLVLSPSFLVDQMETNAGWTFSGTGSSGAWVNDNPNGTGGGSIQPEDDHTSDPGVRCFFTGQTPVGGGIGDNDVDGGTQILTSPTFDLSALDDPRIRYHRWYVNDGNAEVDDVFRIEISSNGGSSWTTVETLAESRRFWELTEFRVLDFIATTSSVRVRFTAADLGSGSIVEAAIDDFEIYGTNQTTDAPFPADPRATRLLAVAPNPVPVGEMAALRFELANAGPVELEIVDVLGRSVVTVASGVFGAGPQTIAWDGRDGRGALVPAGVYFQRFRAGAIADRGRIVILR